VICATKGIEVLNPKIRCAGRTQGHCSGDEATAKLVDLELNATLIEWQRSVRE
jgi:transposase-like protein